MELVAPGAMEPFGTKHSDTWVLVGTYCTSHLEHAKYWSTEVRCMYTVQGTRLRIDLMKPTEQAARLCQVLPGASAMASSPFSVLWGPPNFLGVFLFYFLL